MCYYVFDRRYIMDKLYHKIKSFDTCSMGDIYQVNYMKLPITAVDIETYNEIVDLCKECSEIKRGIHRTPSGGIELSANRQINVWDSKCRSTKKGTCTGAEIVILMIGFVDGVLVHWGGRIQIGKYAEESTNGLSGHNAYAKFRSMLKRRGIDIENSFISAEEGKEEKSHIEKPLIDLAFGTKENTVYEHAYHYDLNSSYAAGMKEKVPEWGELIDYLFNNRKTNSEYKDVLNMTIGYFQSEYIKCRLAHISRYAIQRNNEKVVEKSLEVIRKGCDILCYNTDGFWFTNPKGVELESSYQLGEWKIDHKDCTIRFKSKGVYEFIENGKYTPVARGSTALDRTKPRSTWEWGDIFNEDAKIIIYEFVDGKIVEGESI